MCGTLSLIPSLDICVLGQRRELVDSDLGKHTYDVIMMSYGLGMYVIRMSLVSMHVCHNGLGKHTGMS